MNWLPDCSFVVCCTWTSDARNSHHIIYRDQSERRVWQAGRRCPALGSQCDCHPGLLKQHRVLLLLLLDVRAWVLSGQTNDYVRKHKGFSRKVSSSAQRFTFGWEAVLILLLKAEEDLQPTEAWLISLLKCLALSSSKYSFPIVNSNKWWFVAFV